MGTSTNRASPKTPNWAIPKAVLGRINVDIKKQSQEIWRSALADRDRALQKELSHPIIANLCKVAEKNKSPIDAVAEYNKIVLKSGYANLILDLAKRAFVRCASNRSGSKGFAIELFSEVVSYYASRDLPSYIGKEGRISKPIQSIQLKKKLRETASVYASSIDPQTDIEGWAKYIHRITEKIVREGSEE